jgi:hypothetical protein
MNPNLSIVQPLLVQAGLTFFLLFWMGKERYEAVRDGTVVRNEPGVRPTWLGRAGTISNAFHNQLEMPMLFFVVAILAILTGSADYPMTALAWVYVILRIVHAAIHTTYNKIPHRFLVYILSNLVLLAMWVKLAIHVFTAG